MSKKAQIVKTLKASILGHYTLLDSENFTLERAHGLLEQHKSRRDIHKQKIKLTVHHDGLSIDKAGLFSTDVPHQYYTFENIHRFFVFKADPKLLILGVVDAGKRMIILFHFKKEKETNIVCNEIEKFKGPNKTYEIVAEDDLNDLRNEMRQTNELETFVVETNGEPEVHVDPPVFIEEQVPTRQVFVETAPPAPVANGSVGYIDSVIINDDEPKPDYDIDEPKKMESILIRTNAPHTLSPSVWEEDVKYITYNPKIGSTVSDTGPIYMYTAHQITPEYRGYSMCASSSSSSSSSDDEGEMTAAMQLDDVVHAAEDENYVNSNEINAGAFYNSESSIQF